MGVQVVDFSAVRLGNENEIDNAIYALLCAAFLEGDRKAQKVTSWFLRHQWAPVGNGDVPKIETSFATAYLFGSGDGMELIDRIEDRIDLLPGLKGLNLVRTGIAAAREHVIAEEGFLPPPPVRAGAERKSGADDENELQGLSG